METKVFVLLRPDSRFYYDARGAESRREQFKVRAVDEEHAQDRLRKKHGLDVDEDRLVKVADRSDFDENVDWGKAEADLAVDLGLIDGVYRAGDLGDTVDPPLDEEVLDYVLEHPFAYGAIY